MQAVVTRDDDPRRTLLFGATSMLGWSILSARREPVVAFANESTKVLPAGATERIDLDDEASVVALFARVSPRLILHCAGVCDVESCERSPDFAHAVNVEATQHLIAHAPPDCRIVYLSSDHVFGGERGAPFAETDEVAPISVYGRTRVAAEAIVRARPNTLVIRSGLWIGPSATGKIGHLDWLRDRHRRRLPMTVVSDEVRSAMWAADAAARVWDLAASELTGTRHIIASRAVARPELAAFVNARFAIGATFATEPRAQRRTPHLGNVELATIHRDALAAPMPPVIA